LLTYVLLVYQATETLNCSVFISSNTSQTKKIQSLCDSISKNKLLIWTRRLEVVRHSISGQRQSTLTVRKRWRSKNTRAMYKKADLGTRLF
jgi:hypothetical protein